MVDLLDEPDLSVIGLDTTVGEEDESLSLLMSHLKRINTTSQSPGDVEQSLKGKRSSPQSNEKGDTTGVHIDVDSLVNNSFF